MFVSQPFFLTLRRDIQYGQAGRQGSISNNSPMFYQYAQLRPPRTAAMEMVLPLGVPLCLHDWPVHRWSSQPPGTQLTRSQPLRRLPSETSRRFLNAQPTGDKPRPTIQSKLFRVLGTRKTDCNIYWCVKTPLVLVCLLQPCSKSFTFMLVYLFICSLLFH